MIELDNFNNDGFGWVCLACANTIEAPGEDESRSRLLREGEAESKAPRLSNFALAKWSDAARTMLVCPRCGITESTVKE